MSTLASAPKAITFEGLLEKCSERVAGQGPLGPDQLLLVWLAFENLAKSYFKKNLRLQVDQIFSLAQATSAAPVHLEFCSRWLDANKLSQVSSGAPLPLQPTVRFHSANLEAFYPYEKIDLDFAFGVLLDELQKQLLSGEPRVECELRGLGKIVRTLDKIGFLPTPGVPSKPYQPFDVQTLQQFPLGKSVKSIQFKLPKIRNDGADLERPLEVLVSQDNTNFEKKNPRQARQKLISIKGKFQKEGENGAEGRGKGTGSRPVDPAFLEAKQQHEKMLREFQTATLDTFDFDKDKHFSQAVHTAKDIWTQPYWRPEKGQGDLPKILERHSQTKAKPLALLFNSLSASSRIAINYTPLSKYLFLDPRSKRIAILHNNENDMYSIERLQKQAVGNKEEELSADASNSEEEDQREELAARSRQRFLQLAESLLREDEVIDFPPKLLENLRENAVKNAGAALNSPLLDSVFAEIAQDFKFSLKKGILHYVLKNKEERRRLDLNALTDAPEEFGAACYSQPMVKGVRGTVAGLASFLQENLLLFSQETNEILSCWQAFEKENLFDLNLDPAGTDIGDFIEQQRANIVRIRNLLTTSWIKKISEIYKMRAKALKKWQLRIYFDTMGVVISGQVRWLIESSLRSITRFFLGFGQNNAPPIEEAFARFNDPETPLEKYFLVVNLKEREGRLVFENEIEAVTEELVEVIKDAVKCSENVARPENFFHRLEKNNLDCVALSETLVEETIATVRNVVFANFQRVEQFEFIFRDFYYLFEEKNVLQEIISRGVDQEELLGLFQKYTQLEEDIVRTFPSEVPFNMVKLNATGVKETLRGIPLELRKMIEEHVYREIENSATTIVKTLKNSFEGLTTRIDTVEKLIEKETWLNNFKATDFPILQRTYGEVVRWYERFAPFVRFSFERLRHILEAKEQLIEYKSKIEKEETRIRSERETLEKRLVGRKGVVNSKAVELATKVEGYRREGKAFWIEKMVADLSEAKTSLLAITKDIELINKEEELMGHPKSEFENVRQSGTSILLFEAFWQNLSEWTTEHEKWEKTVIFKLDKEKVAQKSQSIHRNLTKQMEELRTLNLAGPEPLALGEKTIGAIESFQEDFRMVKLFCNPGLGDRHWAEINRHLQSNGLDVKLESGGTYYISTLKDLNLTAFQDGITVISDTATKEFENERFLAGVEAEFDAATLELREYKLAVEMYVLPARFAENTILQLNNHLFRIEMMRNSPYAAVFKAKIEELSRSLGAVKTVLSLWLRVQDQWTYLEPVFNSDDVIKSLPQESMKFKEVQVAFRSFVLGRKRDPSFKELSYDADLEKRLAGMLENLESVDKNLENYLNKKRADFPRLYFLSSEALIEMITATKSPSRLGRHLRGLFGGVHELKISSSDEIEGISSAEGETLFFTQKISIRAFKGHLERWLSALEETILYEIKRCLITGLQDFAKLEKDQFVPGRLSQIALNVFHTAWTFETESSISLLGHAGLKEYAEEMNKTVRSLAATIRQVTSPVEAGTVEAVVNRFLHFRDVLEHLVAQEVAKTSDYAWESQFRIYWEQNNVVENSTSKLQMMYNSLYYGYEYVGPSSRFVVTPLTDKCFRNFFVASQAFYGSCLEGPSATGKSETVKEFARSAGRFLLMLNGSSLFDGRSSLRVLRGLVTSGCWVCIDEFNQIQPDVLSLMAQQLQRMQAALSQGKNEFFFNGSMLKFRQSLALFATINSGYADTTELPENVRHLFRATAVVQPDSRLIVEGKLFCAGFEAAESLSSKLVDFMEIAASILPQQTHHHLGLRKLTTIVEEAARLKQGTLAISETDLVILGVRRILEPQLNPQEKKEVDVALINCFNPEKVTPPPDFESEREALVKAIQEISAQAREEIHKNRLAHRRQRPEGNAEDQQNASEATGDLDGSGKNESESPNALTEPLAVCEPTKQLLAKVQGLKTQLGASRGVILFGPSMTGKSKVLELLCRVVPKTECIRVLAHAVEPKFLYGFNDPKSGEWQAGVLQDALDKVSQRMRHEVNTLLVFDGPMEVGWLEGLNTLLDASSRLTLPNGDTRFLGDKANLVFETDSLEGVSPAMISRCGLVYFESEEGHWKNLARSWVSTFRFLGSADQDKAMVFFLSVYDSILRGVSAMELGFPLNENQIFRNFVLFAENFLGVLSSPESAEMDAKEKLAALDSAFLFSLVWTMKGVVTEHSVKALDLLVKKASKTADKLTPSEVLKQFRKVALPESGSIFDQQLVLEPSKEKGKLAAVWKPWAGQSTEETLTIPGLERYVSLAEHTRQLKVMELLAHGNQPVLVAGPIASGKSLILKMFQTTLPQEKCLLVQTSGKNGGSVMDWCRLVNRHVTRRIDKDAFYPREDRDRLVLVVDDLNLDGPSSAFPNRCGEMLRGILEHSAFTDLEDKRRQQKLISEVQVLASVCRRGSSGLNTRLLGGFRLLAIGDLDDEALNRIFAAQLSPHFEAEFSSGVVQKIPKLITSLVDILKEGRKRFDGIQNSASQPPTIRDALRLAERLKQTTPAQIKSGEELQRLFFWEAVECFGGRLGSAADQNSFIQDVLKQSFLRNFSSNFEVAVGFNAPADHRPFPLLSHFQNMLFTTLNLGEPNSKNGVAEVTNRPKFMASLAAPDQAWGSVSPNLPLIQKTAEYVVRVHRSLQLPNQHLVLLDPNPVFLVNCVNMAAVFEGAQVTDFTKLPFDALSEELDKATKSAENSFARRNVAWVVGEQHLLDTNLVSRLAGFLESPLAQPTEPSTKELPSQPSGEEESGESSTETPRAPTSKSGLHLVFIFGTATDAFDKFSLRWPSLLSRLHVHQCRSWSEESLKELAEVQLSTSTIPRSPEAKLEAALVEMHSAATQVYKEFEDRRKTTLQNHPAMFEGFLEILRVTGEAKMAETSRRLAQLESGHSLLVESEEVIQQQQETMAQLKPVLDEANQKIQALATQIEEKAQAAAQKKQMIEGEERRVRVSAETAQQMADDCQYEINLLQPELDRAQEEVAKITKGELDELKQMKNPPLPVQCALQAVCLLLNTKPELKRDPITGKNSPDWWATSRHMLSGLTIDFLLDFSKKEQVDEATYKRVEAFTADTKNKEFLEENAIKFSSPIAASLFIWVSGQLSLYSLNQALAPKRQALQEANENLQNLQAVLKSKVDDFEQAQEALAALKSELSVVSGKKREVEAQMELLTRKLSFAERLLAAMPEEKERWRVQLEQLKEESKALPAELSLIAAYANYLGPLDFQGRTRAVELWTGLLQARSLLAPGATFGPGLPHLVSNLKVQEWIQNGLQSDQTTINNAALISSSPWPVQVVDPERLSRKLLQAIFPAEKLVMTKPKEENFQSLVQEAVSSGCVLCIEDATFPMAHEMEVLVTHTANKNPDEAALTLWGEAVTVHPDFKLIFVGATHSPTLLSLVPGRLLTVNMEISTESLSEQLVSLVFAMERPNLDQQYKESFVEGFAVAQELNEVEGRILSTLGGDKSQILEDSSVIDVLLAAKQAALNCREKQSQFAETYGEVVATRKEYEGFCQRMASLFFVLRHFQELDPLYLLSLESFLDCLTAALATKHPVRTVAMRTDFLQKLFVQLLCRNQCKGLFSVHRHLFPLVVGVALAVDDPSSAEKQAVLQFILAPVPVEDDSEPDAALRLHRRLERLAAVDPKFQVVTGDPSVVASIAQQLHKHGSSQEWLPEPLKETFSPLEELCILKTFTPENASENGQYFVQKMFGDDFFQLVLTEEFENTVAAASLSRPVFLLLEAGVDPYLFLASRNPQKSVAVENTVMAAGQAEGIGKVVEEAMKTGAWVLIQNFVDCRVAWDALLRKIDTLKSTTLEIPPTFKIFVSGSRPAALPLAYLDKAHRFVLEHPRGLKRAIQAVVNDELLNNQEFIDSCDKKKLLQQISLPLCLAHGAIQERARVQGSGFSRPYTFATADFRITLQQLQMLLSKLGDDFSVEVIKRFMAECNYGGQLATIEDLEVLRTILNWYLNADKIQTGKLRFEPDATDDTLLVADISAKNKLLEFTELLTPKNTHKVMVAPELATPAHKMAIARHWSQDLRTVLTQAILN